MLCNVIYSPSLSHYIPCQFFLKYILFVYREVVIYAWVAFLERAPKQRFASINNNYAAEIM